MVNHWYSDAGSSGEETDMTMYGTKMRVIGGMIPKPYPAVIAECDKYIYYNAGDPSSYPGLEEAIREIVEYSSVLALEKAYPGWITSGATEGNILSILYWRDKGKKRVVAFDTAHYSVRKAAFIAGMEYVEVPTINGYQPDVERLRSKIDEKTVVVATIGTTETGFIDPIEEIRDLVESTDAGLHVDAAFAGAILSGLPEAPRIELDNVLATFVLDLHKIPEAPIPLGVLLAGSQEIIDNMFFDSPYIPSGRQFGLLGSRPGCSVMAGKLALELLLKRYGSVSDIARELLGGLERLSKELAPFYELVHKAMTPIGCFASEYYNSIVERANSMGIRLYKCPRFKGIRIAILPHVLDEVKEIAFVLRSLISPRKVL